MGAIVGANQRRGGSDGGKRRIQDRAKGRRIRDWWWNLGGGSGGRRVRVEGEVAETGVEGEVGGTRVERVGAVGEV